MRNLFILGTVIASVCHTTPVMAQGAESMFSRDRNITVMQRPRPEYDASGIQNGGFVYTPEFRLGLEYTDNVFGTSTAEQSDFTLSLNPSLGVESTWSRHGFAADISGTQKLYADFEDENVFNFTAGASGRIDVVRGSFFEAGGRYSALTEPRTSAGAAGQAAEPIEYDTTNLFVGGERAVGRLRAQARVSLNDYDYEDAPLFGGGIVDQDFRDRNEMIINARGDYAVSPDTALFVRGEINERDYDLAPPAVGLLRDSSGYTLEAGADFDIRGVARGVIGVGYTQQDYDSTALPEIEGLSFDGVLEWFPSELTTVTFNGSRRVQDAAIAGSGGYISANLGVNVDHELRRNLILSAGLNWAEDEYSGLDRTDQRIGANVSATYFMNRNVGARLGYSYVDQDSSGLAGNQDYSRNIVAFSIVIRP